MLIVNEEKLSLVKDTINAYRHRKKDCLEGTYDLEIEEKEWGSATADLQRGYILQRKRLAKRCFQVEAEEWDVSRIPFWGSIPFLCKESFFYDGEYPIGCCRKKVKRFMRFTRNQETIGEFQKNLRLHYYTSGEPGEKAKVSGEDVFYTREPFAERAEYWDANRWLLDRIYLVLVIGVYGLLVLMGIIGLGYAIFPIYDKASTAPAFKVITALLGGLCFMAGYPLKEAGKWYRVLYDKRKRSKEVLQAIQRVKPNFCMEKFLSIADSRIKAIYYMEDNEDVSAFVACDLTNFERINKDVLHCEMISFWFDSFYQDDVNQYIEVTYRAMVFEDAGDRIKHSQCLVEVRFVRPIESIMTTDYYYDWYMDKVKMNSDFKGLKWEVVKNKYKGW